MSPSEFWESTPREVFAFIDGALTRYKQAYRLATMQAYYSGAIARSGGDLPKYEALFPDPDKAAADTTPETHLAFWETLAVSQNALVAAQEAAAKSVNGQDQETV